MHIAKLHDRICGAKRSHSVSEQPNCYQSGVNDFLRAFKKYEDLSYPLPAGITNYGIALKVYGSVPGSGGRNKNIELPDYEEAAKLMATRKNMTLIPFICRSTILLFRK